MTGMIATVTGSEIDANRMILLDAIRLLRLDERAWDETVAETQQTLADQSRFLDAAQSRRREAEAAYYLFCLRHRVSPEAVASEIGALAQ